LLLKRNRIVYKLFYSRGNDLEGKASRGQCQMLSVDSHARHTGCSGIRKITLYIASRQFLRMELAAALGASGYLVVVDAGAPIKKTR
jgi:hypothetical protein